MGDTLATLARDSVTPSVDTSEPEVVERHRVSITAWSSINLQLKETSYQDPDSTIESKGSHKEDTAVGLRTPSRMKQQTSSATHEDGPEIRTGSEIKNLLLQLITQNKEQQSEMNALRLALKNGLEQQESVVRELQGDIAALRVQIEKIHVQNAISDQQPLVKHLTPSGEISFGDTPTNLHKFNLRLAGKDDEIQEIRASPITATSYMTQAISQDTSSDQNSSELNSRSVSESETSKNMSIDASKSEQISPSIRSSNMSESRNEIESPKDEPSDTEDTRHWPRQQSSKESQRQYSFPYSCERSTPRTGICRQGGETPIQPRKNGFEAPKAPPDVRMEALRRLEEALNKVPEADHFNVKRTRTAITLFAGNLDFKARAADMMRSLRINLDGRVRVEEIDIPNYQGRHKGYGFFTLSWVLESHVDPADICTAFSGMIQVKSRRVYFEELHSDVAEKKQEKAYASRHCEAPQETSYNGFYVGF